MNVTRTIENLLVQPDLKFQRSTASKGNVFNDVKNTFNNKKVSGKMEFSQNGTEIKKPIAAKNLLSNCLKTSFPIYADEDDDIGHDHNICNEIFENEAINSQLKLDSSTVNYFSSWNHFRAPTSHYQEIVELKELEVPIFNKEPHTLEFDVSEELEDFKIIVQPEEYFLVA